MATDRRRLTVSKCDPVKPRSPRSRGDAQDDTLKKLVDEITQKNPGKTVFAVSSKTDRDLQRRGSFQDKDQEQLAGDAATSAEYLRKNGIGVACTKGMKPESPNQDSFSIFIVEGVFALYGVFDGHGPNGHHVSDIARRQAAIEFLSHPQRDSNTGEAFKTAFVKTQEFLESTAVTKTLKVDTSSSGTTCTMAYHNVATGDFTIAHVGDSRAVLAGKKDGKYSYINDLTIDHKPNTPEEKARIESANPPGRVVFDGYYNHRVFAQGGMYPGLNMSRALGDVVAHKEAGLSAVPDIKVVKLNDPDYKAKYQGLVFFLCSDGVWEFIESEQVLHHCFQEGALNLEDGVKHLAKQSYKFWMDDSEGEISDDITALVVNVPL